MIKDTNSTKIRMDLVLCQIHQLATKLLHLRYYHVLRDNNEVVDHLTNQATQKAVGMLAINSEVIREPIP
jgi:hypothetical protein